MNKKSVSCLIFYSKCSSGLYEKFLFIFKGRIKFPVIRKIGFQNLRDVQCVWTIFSAIAAVRAVFNPFHFFLEFVRKKLLIGRAAQEQRHPG